jgi:hypothetical protein
MWYKARAKQSVSSLEGDFLLVIFFPIMQREEGTQWLLVFLQRSMVERERERKSRSTERNYGWVLFLIVLACNFLC